MNGKLYPSASFRYDRFYFRLRILAVCYKHTAPNLELNSLFMCEHNIKAMRSSLFQLQIHIFAPNTNTSLHKKPQSYDWLIAWPSTVEPLHAFHDNQNRGPLLSLCLPCSPWFPRAPPCYSLIVTRDEPFSCVVHVDARRLFNDTTYQICSWPTLSLPFWCWRWFVIWDEQVGGLLRTAVSINTERLSVRWGSVDVWILTQNAVWSLETVKGGRWREKFVVSEDISQSFLWIRG